MKIIHATLIALLAAGCAPSSDPSGDVSTGPSGSDAVRIEAHDGRFTPSTLKLAAGEPVTIEVTNRDDAPHDFAIESLGLNTGTIEPGGVSSARFEMPADGIEFRCTYHRPMKGRIAVA